MLSQQNHVSNMQQPGLMKGKQPITTVRAPTIRIQIIPLLSDITPMCKESSSPLIHEAMSLFWQSLTNNLIFNRDLITVIWDSVEIQFGEKSENTM